MLKAEFRSALEKSYDLWWSNPFIIMRGCLANQTTKLVSRREITGKATAKYPNTQINVTTKLTVLEVKLYKICALSSQKVYPA